MGRGCILVKRDLAEAFRHILVAESDWWLLEFCWKNVHYLERYPLFGLRTAQFIFDSFAKGLNWIYMDAGWQTIYHLDDFLAVLKGDCDAEADKYELLFHRVCTQLGLSINNKKNARGTLADFLGIELDTEKIKARLPLNKLLRAQDWVAQVLGFIYYQNVKKKKCWRNFKSWEENHMGCLIYIVSGARKNWRGKIYLRVFFYFMYQN